MNRCPYCGLEPRDDYPVEFRCGSVLNRNRSRACLVREVGQLRDRVADRERERDHANLVADAALRENKSLVERVRVLETVLGSILDNDGSRGTFRAIALFDAKEDAEKLLKETKP